MLPHRLDGVLCAGNIVFDILARPVEKFEWNTSVWIDSIERTMGGNGSNTSYTLGRLGVPVRLLAAAGCDPFGDELLGMLKDAGVDILRVRLVDAPTASTVALVNSRGDRILLHRPGASLDAFAEPIEFSPEVLAGVSHFHLANAFALPHLRRRAAETLRQAREAGLTTSVDTGWDSRGRWLQDMGSSFPFTGLLFVNESEAQNLGGREDPLEAARKLREMGADVVVLKLGGRGCVVLTGEEEIAVPAFDVPVVDTTGAGDCFAGAFLAALHRGRSLLDAARFANAAAALTIQRLGSVLGLRSYEETESWMLTAAVRA